MECKEWLIKRKLEPSKMDVQHFNDIFAIEKTTKVRKYNMSFGETALWLAQCAHFESKMSKIHKVLELIEFGIRTKYELFFFF